MKVLGRELKPDRPRVRSARPQVPDCPGLLGWQILLLAFACGIAAVRWTVPALTCLAVVTLLNVGSRRPGLFYPALFFSALLGAGYAWQVYPENPATTMMEDSGHERGRLSGLVRSVEGKPDGRWQVVVQQARFELPGQTPKLLDQDVVWYWHHPQTRPWPGQEVDFSTTLRPVSGFGNPGSWDYGLYWRMQGVGHTAYCSGMKGVSLGPRPASVLSALRDRLRSAVLLAPAGQGRGLLLALLMGDRFELNPETVDLMRQAGLAHTLALSGLHLGFVAALGWAMAWLAGALRPRLFLTIPRPKLAVLLAAPLVLAYVWLGQASPSLVRAALMFGFWGLLLLRGRGRVLLDGLFLALACILFFSPLSLFDIRLQLSMLAVGGIAVLYPWLHVWMPRGGGARRVAAWALGLLGVSLCANLALLPVTAHLFGMLGPNLLPNLFWLPLLGFVVMPAGALGMLLGALPGGAFAGGLLVSMAAGLLEWMLSVVEGAAAWGLLPLWRLLRPLWPEMLGVTLLFLCALRYVRKPGKLSWALVLLGVLFMSAPHAMALWQDATQGMRLEALDVGQGQAVLVTLPGGRRTIIDGGGLRSRTLETGRDVVGPYLTLGRAPRLHTVVLTHPHLDHYRGLVHLLEYFGVKRFVHNGKWPSGRWGERIRDILSEQGIPVRTVRAGDTVSLGPGVSLDILMPPEAPDPPSTNDGSLVTMLRWHGRNLALLPGDAEEWSLSLLAEKEADLNCDVLVLPHHGSATGRVSDFLSRARAETFFCSCGRYGRVPLPSPALLAMPELQGRRVVDTARNGLLRAQWLSPDAPLQVEVVRSW